MKRQSYLVLAAFCITLLIYSGCSTSQDVNVPKSNMRKQMAFQRHLQKLNIENEKLQKSLKESSVINIETGEVLENNFVNKDNIPELNRILQQYKLANMETQNALAAFGKTIKEDSDKNSELDQMLDGFAIECKQQKDRVDRARELLQEKGDEWTYDNLHIGISAGYLQGTLTDLYADTAYDYDFSYTGSSASAYIHLVGNYHTAIGYQYAVSQGRLDSDDLKDYASTWKHAKTEMNLHIFSVGYRIYGIKVFNIVPQLQYGVGDAKLIHCFDSGCNDDDTNITFDVNIIGLDIPFYHQLSSAFSWGFKISANRVNFTKYLEYVEGEEQDSEDDESNASMETASLGLMIGFAW